MDESNNTEKTNNRATGSLLFSFLKNPYVVIALIIIILVIIFAVYSRTPESVYQGQDINNTILAPQLTEEEKEIIRQQINTVTINEATSAETTIGTEEERKRIQQQVNEA